MPDLQRADAVTGYTVRKSMVRLLPAAFPDQLPFYLLLRKR